MTEEHEKDDTGTLVKTSVSLPPYLYEWVKDVVKSEKKFNSQSSVIIVALSELKGRMEEKEEQSEGETVDKYNSNADDLIYSLLKLLTNHSELIPEFNEIRKKPSSGNDNLKKVQFK